MPASGISVLYFLFLRTCRNRTSWVIQVSKIKTLGRADSNTCRIFSFFYLVVTEGAFVNITFGMRIPCIIRTRSNAGTTTNTLIMLYYYYASLNYMGCSCWTTSYTWSIIAVITSFRSDFNLKIWIGTMQ